MKFQPSIRRTARGVAIGALLIAVAAVAPAHAVELLTNGDFETGDFTGWTVTDQAGGTGSFFVIAPGAATPQSVQPTNPGGGAAHGAFIATSDQTGPGAHALVQSFTVTAGSTVTLSFDMFVNDWSGAGPFIDPAGLDYTASPNQHARVDILTAAATALSTAPADILGNFYLSVDPQGTNPNPFTAYSFDITSIVGAGGTFQLRFGEVDNQLFLNQGVDNVSINAVAGAVPEPVTLALFGLGLAGLGLVRRRRAA